MWVTLLPSMTHVMRDAVLFSVKLTISPWMTYGFKRMDPHIIHTQFIPDRINCEMGGINWPLRSCNLTPFKLFSMGLFEKNSLC